MNGLLCQFAHRFPELAAQILQRDKHKRRNFREETITDILMAGLTAFEPCGIRVDYPLNESVTGEDMDWEFVAPHAMDGRRYLRLHIQAKRAIQSGGKTPYWFYRELDHESPKGAGKGTQAQTLVAQAKTTRGCVPLYMFYHPQDAVDAKSDGLPAIKGVNVIFADQMLQQVGSSWPVAEKKVDRWRPHFMPLSRLLCWAGDSFHAERVGVDGAIEFLVRSSGGNFSPGALADRLNDAVIEFRPSVDRMPVEAVEVIPDSTLRALSGEMSDEFRAALKRPRVLFHSYGVDV